MKFKPRCKYPHIAATYLSDELLNEAEAKIFELSENRSKTDSLKKIEEFVGTTLDKLEELSKKQGELIGSSSGFKAIDGVTQGLQDEDLIVIAGRPSMGKTSLAMNIAENISKNDDGCVAVFSLEMSSQSLTVEGFYKEIFNSDGSRYGGSNKGNMGGKETINYNTENKVE